MRDLLIITCYQFDITDALIKLMGRDNCYLVVDNRPDDYEKFLSEYGDRIISAGPFGYYTIDEALGRVRMMQELMKVTKGEFERVHIISQNCLPTLGWLNRKLIIDPKKEYIHIHESGWTSNYMSITPEVCNLLNSHASEVIDKITSSIKSSKFNFTGALSENIWTEYLKDLPNRVNDDLRMYTYSDDFVYEFKGRQLGKFTKKSSPLTLCNRKATRECLLRDGWYLFARKFEYKSDIYNYWYKEMYKLIHNINPLSDSPKILYDNVLVEFLLDS